MKKIAILPTLLTLGNAICGFASIAFASQINGSPETVVYFALSAWLIIAAMVFDALDGYVARLSKSASDFGGQLDSLCDAISFGAAPAFLLLRMSQEWEQALLRQALAVIAALYVVCAVLRLARFNIENSPDPAYHKRFKGLPSPAAAGCLASLAILRGQLSHNWAHLNPSVVHSLIQVWAPIGGLTVALLMVSRISYPHLTKQMLRGRRHFSHLIRIILVACLIALARESAILLIFWGYALAFPMRYILARSLRHNNVRVATTGIDELLPR